LKARIQNDKENKKDRVQQIGCNDNSFNNFHNLISDNKMKMENGKFNSQDLKVIGFYTAFIVLMTTSIFVI
jgi:hypothetical protein